MWILTIRSASNEPIVFVLKNGINTLGRNPENDIVIADESISRQHAELHCHADRVVLRDLGSRNGTFINLARLNRPKVANSGDQIHFGQRLAHLFRRSTNPLSASIEDLSETKPRVRELSLEPVDKHASLLFDVANRLMLTPDMGNALQGISSLIQEGLNADKCEIIQARDFPRLGELGFSTTVARQAIELRAPVLVPEPGRAGKKVLSSSAKLLHIRTALCVPVLIESEVAGLVYLYRTDPSARLFDASDTRLVTAISHQVSLTIQRARLLEETRVLKKWATTDALTGLDNRRYTLELAELEFLRAQSLGRPLAVLMVDIDNFKQVNDTLGHPAGDQVLKATGVRFRQQLRSIDMLGRYGGDEFIVLLVDTGTEGAQAIAERLRLSIAESTFETDTGQAALTVSLGVAVLTEDCPTFATLIERADQALYASKKGGRNRVTLAE